MVRPLKYAYLLHQKSTLNNSHSVFIFLELYESYIPFLNKVVVELKYKV